MPSLKICRRIIEVTEKMTGPDKTPISGISGTLAQRLTVPVQHCIGRYCSPIISLYYWYWALRLERESQQSSSLSISEIFKRWLKVHFESFVMLSIDIEGQHRGEHIITDDMVLWRNVLYVRVQNQRHIAIVIRQCWKKILLCTYIPFMIFLSTLKFGIQHIHWTAKDLSTGEQRR